MGDGPETSATPSMSPHGLRMDKTKSFKTFDITQLKNVTCTDVCAAVKTMTNAFVPKIELDHASKKILNEQMRTINSRFDLVGDSSDDRLSKENSGGHFAS